MTVPVHGTVKNNIVLYDGYCLMCNRARRWTQALDWFRRLDFVDVYDKQRIAELNITVPSDEELLRSMYLISRDGKIHKGFYAWRKISTLLPLTVILSPLLFIPGIPWIGERVYHLVSEHRTRIVK